MIAPVHSAPDLLQAETIEPMLRAPGPCVTMLLPPFRPGEGAGSAARLVKSNLQAAMRQLAELGLSKTAVTNLLEPLEHPSFFSGSHWSRAIFCSPGVLREFYSTQPLKPALIVAGCFSIKAVLSELECPRAFYVLALAKDRVALLRCTELTAEIAKLPAGVPETLSDSLALEPPDHTIENRSASGPSGGAMKSVRFGTGSGKERERTHLVDFYKLVDRGLQQLLGSETPLILAGGMRTPRFIAA